MTSLISCDVPCCDPHSSEASTGSGNSFRRWQDDFVRDVLPAVQEHAGMIFRWLPLVDREEAVQSAVCLALKAFLELRRQGKSDRIYPLALANYACRQTKDGRSLGAKMNSGDVLAARARKTNGFRIERFGTQHDLPDEIYDQIREHDRAPVPDQAAFRIDFPAWLSTLGKRARRIATMLMLGHSTNAVARKCNISPGRVSQVRKELEDAWLQFHGEAPMPRRVRHSSAA